MSRQKQAKEEDKETRGQMADDRGQRTTGEGKNAGILEWWKKRKERYWILNPGCWILETRRE
jgi:hypothetical protein